jgi:hypothetical protein
VSIFTAEKRDIFRVQVRKGSMPLYTFKLRDGSCGIDDPTGVALPDREQALSYAHGVARELMKSREPQTRTWRLDVYENDGERIFAILFAELDETLDHLPAALRSEVEELCDRLRSLREAISAARVTLRESQALVARSRGKPYLAVDGGRKTIRGM